MKTYAIFLMLLFAVPAFAQDDPLVLTNVVNADVRRLDEGSTNVRVLITINLVVGGKYVTDFFVSPEDVDAFKNGNAAAKLAIAKKYIRHAIRNYLTAYPPPVTRVDQGTQSVSKANLSEAGDTQ